MKTLIRLTIIVTLILTALVGSALAQAPAPGVWHTGLTVRNMSFWNTTPVYIEFLDETGYLVGTWSMPGVGYLESASSIFIYAGSITGLPAETSATVYSDQNVAVAVNLASDYPDKTESAYMSMREAQASTELFAPGVYKNYYGNSSAIRVQNAGDAQTSVRVRYYRLGETSPTHTEYRTVPKGAGYTFLQEDLQVLGTSFIGSAVIDAGQPLAAITNISIDPGPYPGNDNPWRLHAIHEPVIDGHFEAFFPVLCNGYYDNISAVTIMNMRSAGQWVRMNYGPYYYSDKLVPGNSSALWYTPNEGPPTGWHGAGIAACITGQGGVPTTNCEIVGTVNQINHANGNFASYVGGSDYDANRVSQFPIIVKDYTDVSYMTSISCMNTDDSDAVHICLKIEDLGYTWCNYTNAGESTLWYLPHLTQVPAGYNGSGYAYAYYSEFKIVCVVQQNGEAATVDGDWLTTYNGVPGW